MTLNHITVSKDVTGVLYCHCAIISVLSFYLYLMLMMSKCGILTSFLHNYIQGPLLSKHPIFQHAKYTLSHVLSGKVWDICQEYFRKKWVMSPYNYFNSLRPRPNRRHFTDDIFKCIFKNENEWISHRISLKFVPKVRVNNIPALVQIMAWRRPGDKPLSEAMLVSLLTHICVTRPQWVNSSPPITTLTHLLL